MPLIQLLPPASPQLSVYSLQKVADKPDMIPVYVSHIKTPSFFSVQLIGEKTTKSLECLQDDLTRFYSGSASDEYTITNPYVGQVRVCVRLLRVWSFTGLVCEQYGRLFSLNYTSSVYVRSTSLFKACSFTLSYISVLIGGCSLVLTCYMFTSVYG